MWINVELWVLIENLHLHNQKKIEEAKCFEATARTQTTDLNHYADQKQQHRTVKTVLPTRHY